MSESSLAVIGDELIKAELIGLCVRRGQWEIARSALRLPGDSGAQTQAGARWLMEIVAACRRGDYAKDQAAKLVSDLMSLGADPLDAELDLEADAGFRSQKGSAMFRALAGKELGLAEAMAASPSLDKKLALERLSEEGFRAMSSCALGPRGVKLFLSLGESPDAASPDGRPWAHFCKTAETLQALVDAGASVEAEDKMGVSLDERVSRLEDAKERQSMMETLAKIRAASNPKQTSPTASQLRAIFQIASSGSKAELFKAIKSRGLSARALKDEFGRSLLARALMAGNWGAARGLMAAGLDPMALAPSGEPEACYLFAWKGSPRSGSVAARQRFEAAEAMRQKLQWGWRSAEGRTLIEELVANPGASSYEKSIRGALGSSRGRVDWDLGLWFLKNEPASPLAPLSARLLKTPGLEPLGSRAIQARPADPFDSPQGESAPSLLAAYFFESLVKEQSFERGEARKLAQSLMGWMREADPSDPDAPARAPASLGQIESALERAASLAGPGAAAGNGLSYSSLSALDIGVAEFVQGAFEFGWSPDFDRLSPTISQMLSQSVSFFGRSNLFEGALDALQKNGGPRSAAMILDALSCGSEPALKAARRWLDKGLAAAQGLAFPNAHQALKGELPEHVAVSPLWREVESLMISQRAAAPDRAASALRI